MVEMGLLIVWGYFLLLYFILYFLFDKKKDYLLKVSLDCVLPFFQTKEDALVELPRNDKFFTLEGTLEHPDLVM